MYVMDYSVHYTNVVAANISDIFQPQSWKVSILFGYNTLFPDKMAINTTHQFLYIHLWDVRHHQYHIEKYEFITHEYILYKR